jgi:hypothetical protein
LSVFRYAISALTLDCGMIPRQCGMLTIGAFPITLPLPSTAACRVRKVGSRSDAVFVEESAEAVSALDDGRGRVQDLQLTGQVTGRLEIE